MDLIYYLWLVTDFFDYFMFELEALKATLSTFIQREHNL